MPRRSAAGHCNRKRAASRSTRNRLIALLAVTLVAAVGAGTSCHSKATGGELVLTGATDPGVNAFMPPAASPPPTSTQAAPTLQPHGDGTTVATQPLPGGRDGLYGGTVNNAGADREKVISFLGGHPAQAGAFVEALNSDPTLYWSGGHPLTAVDIPAYLRELTPALLRLDTRVTDYGFDGSLRALQSVFQAGTAVLVDALGVPRVRGCSGDPLIAPIALVGVPEVVGTPWPGYLPGALAAVEASAAILTNFVLYDVLTGLYFNRPVGTIGANDTPHTQAVATPEPGTSSPTTTGKASQLDIDGTYAFHYVPTNICGSRGDATQTLAHQGNTLTIRAENGQATGSLNGDGSFSVSGTFIGARGIGSAVVTWRGVFATEGGRTVIRGGTWEANGCTATFSATKQ